MTGEEKARVASPIRSFPHGCGYTCPYRDWVSGVCERHGPTDTDRIVERVTQAFRNDVARILKGAK